ncbi:MAG TPA: serine hydrolase [Candidatus Saccharimonadales bacterium]
MKTKINKPTFHRIQHKRKHLVLLTLFWIVLAIVFLQLLYPQDRALPFARLEGRDVGGFSSTDITEVLKAKYERDVDFTIANKPVFKAKIIDSGVTPHYNETVGRATDYPLIERLVPLSILVKHLFSDSVQTQYTVDPVKVRSFVASKVLPLCNVKPVNAVIRIEKDDVVVKEGTEGRVCDAQEIEAKLQRLPGNGSVALAVKTIEPTQSRAKLEPLLVTAKQRLSQGISLTVDGKEYPVDTPVFATWFVFQEDIKTHQVRIAANKSKISAYLSQFNKKHARAAQTAKVFTLDGAARKRIGGKEGRSLDAARTASALHRLVERGGDSTVPAVFSRISPAVEYIRDYSPTQHGLSVLLQDLAREKGMYGITVMELGGKKRQADVNGTHIFTTASTYKLFVAYSVLKEIEAGNIRWKQHIRDGKDTAACFDEMLLYSLNPCSWTFRDMVGGWAKIQQQMRGLGLANTYLVQNDLRSTSNDESLFLRKLELGESLRGESRSFLLRMLRSQIYRSGIPNGVRWPVANKIGFLEGFLHDVGIIYSPKGTYILGVMTYGGSWWQIADVAKRVDALMQR